MKKFITVVVIIVLLILLVGVFTLNQPIAFTELQDPIKADQKPIQTITPERKPIKLSFSKSYYSLSPLYEYKIEGRVLSKKRYGGSWDAKLSPYDLVLGWGQLADKNANKHIKFDQWGRFYFYKFGSSSYLSLDEINRHSSNNHIIPANVNLKKALKKIKKNDMVVLEGVLVSISGYHKNKSVHWNTSTSRDDKGNGACEIIYLKQIRINNKIYR